MLFKVSHYWFIFTSLKVLPLIAATLKTGEEGTCYIFRALLAKRPFYLNHNNVNQQQCGVDNNHTIN